MAKQTSKPRLAIAGPGAGKTHNMVDEIVAVLPHLAPHRHLAAITYTNAAASVIRQRLHARTALRRNVFVGTTHSFISRFILQPFGCVFGELPSERIYGAIDVRGIATERGAKTLAPAALQGAVSKITGHLIAKGVVPYDAMLQIAQRLLAQKGVRELLGSKLQFVFVDEFQDTDTRQSVVFDEIRKSQLTRIYAVGDPEQYVMGFTYAKRGQAIREFGKIPFFAFEKASATEQLTKNHRANGELVEFANQFRRHLTQTATKPKRGRACVIFIEPTEIAELITQFQSLSNGVDRHEQRLSRLYLGTANKMFDGVRTQYDLIPVSNDSRKTLTFLGDALELLAFAVGQSQSRCRDEFALSPLQWRRMGISLLNGLQSADWDTSRVAEFVKQHFGVTTFGSREEAVDDGVHQLRAVLSVNRSTADVEERCSSIHRAKGLEADAVLVVAETPNELSKWIDVDHDMRANDKLDKCRLG